MGGLANDVDGDSARRHFHGDTDPGYSIVGQQLRRTDPRSIVIIGAGTIGRLMAFEAAISGNSVTLIDRDATALKAARDHIQTQISAAPLTADQSAQAFSRIHFLNGDVGADEEVERSLLNAALVIEAIPEVLDVKRSLLGRLNRVVPPRIPIATVSSSFTVGELSKDEGLGERLINLHPLAAGIKAVEVMPGPITNPAIANEVLAIARDMSLIPIEVLSENVGFIFNIMWRGMKKTALDLVQREVCRPQDLDRIFMMAFKTPLGPFAVMDLVGLDIVLQIENAYAARSGNPDDMPPAFLKKMVSEGRLGRKSPHGGFYNYPNPSFAKPGFLETGSAPHEEQITIPTRDTLIGTWKLESFSSTDVSSGVKTYPFGTDAIGTLIYASDGEMSVMIATKESQIPKDPGADPLKHPHDATSLFVYTGTARIGSGVVFHDIEFCSHQNWAGTTVTRQAHLEGERLILTTPPTEHSNTALIHSLAWRKKRS